MKTTKMICSIDHYRDMKLTEWKVQSKDQNTGSYRINKTSLSFTHDEKYILNYEHSRLWHFLKPAR